MMRHFILLVLLLLPALLPAGEPPAGVSTVDDLLSKAVGITIDSPGPIRKHLARPALIIYMLDDYSCALVYTKRTTDERPVRYVAAISRCECLPAASLLGDADDNGRVDMGDVIFLVNFIFNDGPIPQQPFCADITGDSRVDTGDVAALIKYLHPDARAER